MKNEIEPVNSLTEALQPDFSKPIKIVSTQPIGQYLTAHVQADTIIVHIEAMDEPERDSYTDYERAIELDKSGLIVSLVTVGEGHPCFGMLITDPVIKDLCGKSGMVVASGSIHALVKGDEKEPSKDYSEFWTFIMRVGPCDDFKGNVAASVRKQMRKGEKTRRKLLYMQKLKETGNDKQAQFLTEHLERISFAASVLTCCARDFAISIQNQIVKTGETEGLIH